MLGGVVAKTVTLAKLVQPEKAITPIRETLAGIVMLVNPVQPEKSL
jgi:flagellar biosynthesis regulator FlbT